MSDARPPRRMRGPRDERGVTTLEVVLLVPVFFACMFLAVAAGRLGQARGDIDAVARDAARAGSIVRSADEAAAAAQATANDVLADRGLTCADLAVAVDTRNYRAGGWVRVDVSCTIPLTELTGVWTPGAKTIQAQGLAVVDTFRRAA